MDFYARNLCVLSIVNFYYLSPFARELKKCEGGDVAFIIECNSADIK
jgi:hypothetical protein